MITTATVLVLGAGASVHCGYPLGGQLISSLCRLRGTTALDELPYGYERRDAEKLLTRLSRSGHYSVDAFLETAPEHVQLGKYLIARELKAHESLDGLFPPGDAGWYQYLFNSLLAPGGDSDLSRSRLAVITFNYDRSLEAYLHTALQNRFQLDERAATEELATVPIVHVHGILGAYPEVPYESSCSEHELQAIAQKIQVIHEIADPEDGFCSPAFEAGHALLRTAERIYFLGFGFHHENIRRFRFFSPQNTAGKLMRATTAGMGTSDRASLVARLADFGFGPDHFRNDGSNCSNFFNYSASLVSPDLTQSA